MARLLQKLALLRLNPLHLSPEGGGGFCELTVERMARVMCPLLYFVCEIAPSMRPGRFGVFEALLNGFQQFLIFEAILFLFFSLALSLLMKNRWCEFDYAAGELQDGNVKQPASGSTVHLKDALISSTKIYLMCTHRLIAALCSPLYADEFRMENAQS